MASMNYECATIKKWESIFTKQVKDLEKAKNLRPHFGTVNHKTNAINEGTLPFITCDKCAITENGCGHSCYAFRTCLYSKEAEHYYAINTIVRRRNPLLYYRQAFAAAFASGALLRLNESGDFENVNQFKAAIKAANEFKNVKCITYTHRRKIAVLVRNCPKNMICRYSAWLDAENIAWAKKNRVSFCAVSANPQKEKGFTYCLAQMREDENERRIKDGIEPLPIWTCAACSASGCGCASKKNIVFRLH